MESKAGFFIVAQVGQFRKHPEEFLWSHGAA